MNDKATVDEIARYADVPVESVLRVLNHEDVSEGVTARVLTAMHVHGFTPPGESEERALEVAPEEGGAIEQARKQLLQAFAQAAAALEESLPKGMSSVLYNALRVEVGPVAERMDVVDGVLDELAGRVQQVRTELRAERNDRVDDLALLVDLITTSWRMVDRRLGRIERKLERMEAVLQTPPASRIRAYE